LKVLSRKKNFYCLFDQDKIDQFSSSLSEARVINLSLGRITQSSLTAEQALSIKL